MEREAVLLEAIVWNDPWWFGVAGRRCIHPAAIGEEDSTTHAGCRNRKLGAEATRYSS
jgi:hypothetical protein